MKNNELYQDLIKYVSNNSRIEAANLVQQIEKQYDTTVLNAKIILKIIYELANYPLQSQKEIAKKYNLTLEDLKKNNLIIKGDKGLQSIILNDGIGSKFWQNTILPVEKSGAISNFLKKKYSYPFRVGLFPGLSCMFKCTFCGRNYDAKYERKYAEIGMDVFTKIITEAPKNDPNRFFLSGGLEPLTNPYLNQIIKLLNDNNFNSALYTNGYMLTKKYLEKNLEISNLSSLRISIYGVNQNSTAKITQNSKAFGMVDKNIYDYLEFMSSTESKTKFGFNYVIVKENINDVINLFKNIKKYNDYCYKKNLSSSINFVTLREDFRIFGNRANDSYRKILFDNLQIIENMKKNYNSLKNVYIDYGFALEGLLKNFKNFKVDDTFATFEDIKILGVPHARIAIDIAGDAYLYGEAGFLERPGAKKYIIGNVLQNNTMEDLFKNYHTICKKIIVEEKDRDFLDAWDHVVTKMANIKKENLDFGINDQYFPIEYQTSSKITAASHQVHFSSSSNRE